jgi:MFS family permease
MYFGRRPVYVFSSICFFATIIWSAVTHNFTTLVVSRILTAFMGSSPEALGVAVVPDLFFLHERGWWMGVYTLFISVGGFVGSIISGFVITELGWRWVFWVLPLISSLTRTANIYLCGF